MVEACKKTLIVTSAKEHEKNVELLTNVDDEKNPVEWITSVSMLTEGWDVENVFQIVPHEERAFNSKLLIAQVLGRGLRIPHAYLGEQPVVTVFNHDNWSVNIKHLVNEILEIENRVNSYAVIKEEDYHFELDNIEYEKIEKKESQKPATKPFVLLKKGYVSYSSQAEEVERKTTYVKAVTEQMEEKRTIIEFKKYSIPEAANHVFNKLKAVDMDLDSNYSQKFPISKLESIIKESLKRIKKSKDWVSEINLQKTLKSFDVAYRKKTSNLRVSINLKKIFTVSTMDLRKSSIGVGSLRRDGTIIWDDYTLTLSNPEDQKLIKELEGDESLPRSALIKVENKFNFKTPLNLVTVSHTPERKFVQNLILENISKAIDSWVKSTDTGFYSIEYVWRKGEHPKHAKFNPDFFIKIGKDVLVAEIKMDTDVSPENKAKMKYARLHFERLNKLQKNRNYFFKFLSPNSYDLFFKSINEGTYDNFKSELEAKLDE